LEPDLLIARLAKGVVGNDIHLNKMYLSIPKWTRQNSIWFISAYSAAMTNFLDFATKKQIELFDCWTFRQTWTSFSNWNMQKSGT